MAWNDLSGESRDATPAASAQGKAEQLLTEQQLATRWGISPKTLRNTRVTGSAVPFVRIGRLIRYPLSAVLDYERRQTRFSTGV